MSKVIPLGRPEEQLARELDKLEKLRAIADIMRKRHGTHSDGYHEIARHVREQEERVASLKRPA